MKRRRNDERYLVLQWRRDREESSPWKLNRATIVHSLRMAKRLQTLNEKYWNIRTQIVAEALIEGIGELTEPVSAEHRRKQVLTERLADIFQ